MVDDDDDPPVRDLSKDELIVLAGVLRLMMMADAQVTHEEIDSVSVIGRRLGLAEDEWDDVWDRASRTLRSPEMVKDAASRLARTSAREAVYELLYQLADADSIADEEWDLLEWLDETWLQEPATS